MASVRQRKKQLRAQTAKQLRLKLAELETLNTQIEDINKEIRKAKKILRRRSSTLAQLQYQISNVKAISQRTKSLKTEYGNYIKVRDISRTQSQIRANIVGDDTYVGSLIKKYWDYVDAGLIHHQNGLSQYEQAEFIENNLSGLEMKSAIEQADKWRDATAKREEERRSAFRSSVMDIIPF